MSQGLVHNQPLLYASPAKEPRSFLGTLPSPSTSKDDKTRDHDVGQVPLCLQRRALKQKHPLVTHLLVLDPQYLS